MKLLGVVVVMAACGAATEVATIKPREETPPPQTTTEFRNPNLIPRRVLLAPTTRESVELSPDGMQLSWFEQGALWVAPADAPDQARALLKLKISRYSWSPTSRALLYEGKDGHLYDLTLEGKFSDLTPYGRVDVRPAARDVTQPTKLLAWMNDRDHEHSDLYELDLATGKRTMSVENTLGFTTVITDAHLRPRVAEKHVAGHDLEIYVTDDKPAKDGKRAWTLFDTVGFYNRDDTYVAGISRDGRAMYLVDSRVGDTSAAVSVDIATKAKTVLASDPKSDIVGTMHDPETGELVAVGFKYARLTWTATDPGFADDLAAVAKLTTGTFTVPDKAGPRWLVHTHTEQVPDGYWLYDRTTKQAKFLFSVGPDLDNYKIAPMTPVEIPARDGTILVGQLTLPIGRQKPMPMVLLAHDGPWGHVAVGPSSLTTLLADRGYAVLSMNARGSGGLGKRYVEAGHEQYGKKVVEDALDSLRWAEHLGIAALHETCIVGTGLTGHTALSSLEAEPDAFACAIGVNPVVDPALAITELPDTARRRMLGDPTTPEGAARLKQISLMTNIAAIKKPVLVVRGGADQRTAGIAQLLAIVRANGGVAVDALARGVRDPSRDPANLMNEDATIETFLHEQLGGAYEPATKEEMHGSTMTFDTGASP